MENKRHLYYMCINNTAELSRKICMCWQYCVLKKRPLLLKIIEFLKITTSTSGLPLLHVKLRSRILPSV